MNSIRLSAATAGCPPKGERRPSARWGRACRLLLAAVVALLMCVLLGSRFAPLAHAQSACLTVAPHILPQKETIPTIEQLWITVGNGCPTVAQNGSLHVTDSLKCNGSWLTGLDETLGPFTWQPGTLSTPFTVQAYQTGCPPGTVAAGPLEEWLHGDAQAVGPSGQAYHGEGDTYYTFS